MIGFWSPGPSILNSQQLRDTGNGLVNDTSTVNDFPTWASDGA